MRRFVLAGLVAALTAFTVAPAVQAATSRAAGLKRTLNGLLETVGPRSGAWVQDAKGRVLFDVRSGVARTMASNTKPFTSAALLDAIGPAATLDTEAVTAATLLPDGTLEGDLVLRGGGDPTFGDRAFVTSEYGIGATVEDLASKLKAAGLLRVRGQVLGDGSLFDADRGEPGWELNDSPMGPLGGLTVDRGLMPAGSSFPFQRDVAGFAAQKLRDALFAAGIAVDGGATTSTAPAGTRRLAAVSTPLATVLALMNKPSNNFFAETLTKLLAAKTGRPGTRAAGVEAILAYAKKLRIKGLQLVNGSGANPANRGAPREIARLFAKLQRLPYFKAFFDSLPIAGRDGTLETRMRAGPAAGRCHAKTGTFETGRPNVGATALSGYCPGKGGRIVFSIVMNDTGIPHGRKTQDRMVTAIARYGLSG